MRLARPHRADPHPPTADRETRGRILEVAEGLFIDRGFKGVSMKEVATAVQVTPAALYYHFPGGKDELFVETIRQFLHEMIERAFRGIESTPDFRARLTLLTRNVLTTPIDRLAPLMRDAHGYLEEAKPDLMSEIATTFGRRATELFQEAMDADEVSPAVPADLLATLHQGMCIALLNRRHLFGQERIASGDDERLAQTLVAVLLDGVGPTPPALPTP